MREIAATHRGYRLLQKIASCDMGGGGGGVLKKVFDPSHEFKLV